MLSELPFEVPHALIDKAKALPPVEMAVAGADHPVALESARQAAEAGLIVPTLVGDKADIERIARDIENMRALSATFGRTLKFGISAHVICAETRKEAIKLARALEAYGARDRISLVAAKALGAGLVGTADDTVERLAEMHRIGVDTPMLHFYPMLDGLETFATEVMPRLPA